MRAETRGEAVTAAHFALDAPPCRHIWRPILATSSPSSTAIESRFDKSQNDLVLQSSDFSLNGLREMVDSEIIDLEPQYQRRERWDTTRQSALIESFLLNIPVPPIYLSEEEYGVYAIIDGKQRITAIHQFLSNSLRLKALGSFTELNGYRFRDLPTALKNALKIRPFLRVITLLKQSAPDLKYQVFLRLNKGGIRLNNQEIRNVACRGFLNAAIYSTGENNAFLKRALRISGPKSKAYQQMQDAELVLRFLTLRENWQQFSGSFSRSMDQFMMRNSHLKEKEADDLVAVFVSAISRVEQVWGDHAFRRWDGQQWRQQALAGLYDAQMIACDQMGREEFAQLRRVKTRVIEATRALFLDSVFEEAVRLGTNTPARMTYRVKSLLDGLRELIKSP